jgi:hypothetical protein
MFEGVDGVLVGDRLIVKTAVLSDGLVLSPDRGALRVVHIFLGMQPDRAHLEALHALRRLARLLYVYGWRRLLGRAVLLTSTRPVGLLGAGGKRERDKKKTQRQDSFVYRPFHVQNSLQ